MSGLLIVVCVRRILVPVLIGPKHKQTRNNTAVATISLGMLVVRAGGVRGQHGPMVRAGGFRSQHGPLVCAGGTRSQHGPTDILFVRKIVCLLAKRIWCNLDRMPEPE